MKVTWLRYAGLFLIIVGLMVLVGHMFGMSRLTDLGLNSDMAPITAICLIVIGISKLVLAHELEKKKER